MAESGKDCSWAQPSFIRGRRRDELAALRRLEDGFGVVGRFDELDGDLTLLGAIGCVSG